VGSGENLACQNVCMRLFTAIVPPREVLEEVKRVVQSVNPPLPSAEKPRLSRRPGRRYRGAHAAGREPVREDPQQLTESTTHELSSPDVEDMYIALAGFGNVTLSDATKLAAALRPQVATWSAPQLVFSGAAALEFPGDQSVWSKLDGDLESLNAIGKGVPLAVQRMGYFVDRRKFRPWLPVGTITETTTAPYLERLVAALDEFRGQPWRVEGVSLMKGISDTESGRRFEVMELMPLAGGSG
jgi:RNA 2',3'-cyclic 3'-phosphodiesterase